METNDAEQTEQKEQDIAIVELVNPAYLARNKGLHELLKEFIDNHCGPSVTFESVLNFMSSLVYSVYSQQMAGVHKDAITIRFWLGFVDGKLDGFFMYFLAADRMPHIQSIDVTYIYSKNVDVTLGFLKQLEISRRRWNADHLLMNVANEKLKKVILRVLVKPKKVGEYYVAEGMRFGDVTEGE